MANSKRKCKHCGDYQQQETMFKTNIAYFCSHLHAAAYAYNITMKKQAKARAKSMRETKAVEIKDRKKTKTDLYRLKSHRAKLADAQPVFNELRRWQELEWFADRGLEPVCISCQKPLGNDQWCAGHLKSAGEHSNTRFDRMNVHLQHNKRCNMALSGDIVNYKLGLVKRFGEQGGSAIIEHCETESKKLRRYEDDELIALKKEWRAEIRRLKKELS